VAPEKGVEGEDDGDDHHGNPDTTPRRLKQQEDQHDTDDEVAGYRHAHAGRDAVPVENDVERRKNRSDRHDIVNQRGVLQRMDAGNIPRPPFREGNTEKYEGHREGEVNRTNRHAVENKQPRKRKLKERPRQGNTVDQNSIERPMNPGNPCLTLKYAFELSVFCHESPVTATKNGTKNRRTPPRGGRTPFSQI
jgi:hypothetical protein